MNTPQTPGVSIRPVRKTGRLRKVLRAAFLILALLLAGLWLWSGSNGSLNTALALARHLSPALSQSLTTENVSGSIRNGGTIGALRWQQPGQEIRVSGITFSWNALALVRKRLTIRHLRAETVQIVHAPQANAAGAAAAIPSPQGSTPPAEIRLPILLDVQQLEIGAIVQGDDPGETVASDIRASYVFDGAQHRLELQSLQMGDGHYTAQASLSAQAPKLEASLTGALETAVPGGEEKVRLNIQAIASGPLQTLDVQAEIKAEQATAAQGPELNLQAIVQPWEALPLQQLSADFRDFNARVFWPPAPQTLLEGTATLTADSASDARFEADIRNHAAGTLDASRLPIDALTASGHIRDGLITVEPARITTGDGRVDITGQFHIQQRTWETTAKLTGIDPARLLSTLASDSVSGTLHASQASAETIAFDAALNTARAANVKHFGVTRASAAGTLQQRNLLQFSALDVRTREVTITSDALTYTLDGGAASGPLHVTAPGMTAQATLNSFAEHSGSASISMDITAANRTSAWLGSLPFNTKALTTALNSLSVYGQNLSSLVQALPVVVDGGWADPHITVQVDVQALLSRLAADQLQKRLIPGADSQGGKKSGKNLLKQLLR